MYGLVDTARALLKAGHDANVNFNYREAAGSEAARHCTAAHWCAAMAALSPASDNYNDDDDDGPILHASQLDVLEVLVREGHADINARDADGQSPLYWLFSNDVRDAEIAALDRLVSLGADVNARNKHGKTPLFLLAKRGNLVQLQRLMEHGASPDAVADRGWTPLIAAAGGAADGRPCSSVSGSPRRDVVLELLRRSSQQTRRTVMIFTDWTNCGAIDFLLFATQAQLAPWHRQVIGELLASGAPVWPPHAAPVLPSAAERAQQGEDELAARRSESRRWRAHEDVSDLAQEAEELSGAQQGVEERRARVAALEAELRALGAGETTSSCSSENDDDDDDDSVGQGGSDGSQDVDGAALEVALRELAVATGDDGSAGGDEGRRGDGGCRG